MFCKYVLRITRNSCEYVLCMCIYIYIYIHVAESVQSKAVCAVRVHNAYKYKTRGRYTCINYGVRVICIGRVDVHAHRRIMQEHLLRVSNSIGRACLLG